MSETKAGTKPLSASKKDKPPEKSPYVTGSHFMSGNEACAEGALLAGCRFFAGYPITPSTEIAEHMAKRLPAFGGVFVQMEDELASMNAILGGAWAGKKSMSATSGPGFSLMMENLGLGIVLETPTVLVNIQRGGPSTGLPTLVGQGDMMQARWGSHGPYEIIALCPNSPQDMLEVTIKAFNLSEEFRIPVLVMSDETVGHMSEKVIVPPLEEVHVVERKIYDGPPEKYLPHDKNGGPVAPMTVAGMGTRLHTTGLTHDKKGYPFINEETQKFMVEHLVDKIRNNKDRIIMLEEEDIEDADIVLVSYGITSRIALYTHRLARKQGLKTGWLRLITAWPFAEDRIREIAPKVRGFVVPEINMGQMVLEVERAAAGQAAVKLVPHPGGGIHTPGMIMDAIREVANG
jgi:2-oxoglutarate ferredoxin oxidoreductase subunit alpha